ncbi:MAG TPA: M28 family peptidase [Gemmatimonadaceae bacterium]
MRTPDLRRSVRLVAGALLVAACQPSGTPARPAPDAGPAVADSAALRRDVSWLAADALEGRATGSPGNDSAALYVARRFQALGLEAPLAGSAGCPASSNGASSCLAGYAQPFTARSAALAHSEQPWELPTRNVVGILRGSDPALRHEYVVVGAHFDHLGRGTNGALDPGAGDAIRNGADDNASGTAAVLELARLLSRRPPARSVVFVAFSGEELGLLGSQHFVEHPPVPLDRVRAMLNFDMIGRLRDDRLIVYGVASATELPAIVDSANAAAGFAISAVGDGFGPSDHSSFYGKGIPVLHFFTDLHEDYHRATDDAPLVNAAGMARVVDLAERIAREIADRPSPLTYQRSAAPVASGPSTNSNRVYLGTIPDMAAGEGNGLRITGVTPGSPGDEAGLRAGDVVVELGGKPVKDLYSYTDALYANEPGDVVRIVVLRGGERVTVEAKLTARGRR